MKESNLDSVTVGKEIEAINQLVTSQYSKAKRFMSIDEYIYLFEENTDLVSATSSAGFRRFPQKYASSQCLKLLLIFSKL